MNWLKHCHVGKVHSPDDVITLQSKFISAGILSQTVRPMGGDVVLMHVADDEDL